jgi:hypothetical protein
LYDVSPTVGQVERGDDNRHDPGRSDFLDGDDKFTGFTVESLIISTRPLPRAIGYLAGGSGIAYIAHGYLLSTDGFSTRGSLPNLLGMAFGLLWIAGLAVTACRFPELLVSDRTTTT